MSGKVPLKVLVVGSSDSGKGMLLRHFATPLHDVPQPGIRFFKRAFKHKDLGPVELEIFEWVKDDSVFSPKAGFYRGTNGACVVYDIRSVYSFELAKEWVHILQEVNKINAITLIGNFAEQEADRTVSAQIAREYASNNVILYHEVNSKRLGDFLECLYDLVKNIHLFNYA